MSNRTNPFVTWLFDVAFALAYSHNRTPYVLLNIRGTCYMHEPRLTHIPAANDD